LQPISGDTSSDRCQDQVRRWIKECDAKHRKCLPGHRSDLPKRVLDIGSDGSNNPIRLHESTPGEKAKYVCLSHCWGKHVPLTTTPSTLAARKRQIELSDMPPTFRDAVVFTKRLGIRFLWIDSLCIVQDDRADWADQAGKMAGIYKNSYLTLAATDSTDSSGGLFRKAAVEYQSHRLPAPKTQELYARVPLDHFDGGRDAFHMKEYDFDFTSYPLLRRAWVLQEQVLSPRTLHFLRNEVAWECSTARTCECGGWLTLEDEPELMFTQGKSPQLQEFSLPSKRKGLSEILGLSRAPKRVDLDKFHKLIEHYTKRAITMPTDRLPACAAVAKEYHPIITGNYLAGHWEAAMPLDLLWHNSTSARLQKPIGSKGEFTGRPAKYIAPTWSWASINSTVSWDDGLDPHKYSKLRPIAKVVEANCQPEYNDPYLQISNGYLILRAPFLEAIYSRLPNLLECDSFSCHKFIPDYELRVEDRHHLSDGEKLLLVVIAQNQTFGREEQCLVLKHVPGTTADEHWRIGICKGRVTLEPKTVQVRNFRIV